MKITGIKTFIVGNPPPHCGGRNFVFLKLVTDEGPVGYGECDMVGGREHTVARLIEKWGQVLGRKENSRRGAVLAPTWHFRPWL